MKFARRMGWDPESITLTEEQAKEFNRWKLIPAGIVNHICLGSIFAWSIFNAPLMQLEGVIVQAPTDWTLGDVAVTFSLVMGGFAWGAILGKYLDKWGPSVSCKLGALSLASGFGLAASAAYFKSLPLLYAGGLVWGLANGTAYVPPVATLLRWFSEQKGFAGGAALIGFGGGAMIATPIFQNLLNKFRVAPDYLGSVHDLEIINEGGRLFVETADALREVVIASHSEAAVFGLDEGVYLLGTGSTGVAETFLLLGAGYSSIMAFTSTLYRLPPEGYAAATLPPAQSADGAESAAGSPPAAPAAAEFNVDITTATQSRQFWLTWTGFGCSIAGTYGILSTGKTMLTEAFQTTVPDIVTAGFAGGFVVMMSVSNLVGRIFWSNLSDVLARRLQDPFLGRRATYTLMWGSTPPMYAAIVWSVHECSTNPGMLPLGVFCGAVAWILAGFGGAAATRPALAADLWGTKHVTVMTARQLSIVLIAAYVGPKIATSLREDSMHGAMLDLASHTDPEAFHTAFGSGIDGIEDLIAQKSISISKLMEIAPAGTLDPTPFVYDNTMYVMIGLNGMALVTNLLLRTMDPSTHSSPRSSSKPASL